MPPTTPLTGAELDQALSALPGWTVTDGLLSASFTADRAALPGLYTAVAAAEDAADHHAVVRILYTTIGFGLNTHDAGGAITAKDTTMAARISELAAAHHARPAG
ncbi:4a-hydroxytetrahydrobiopterin dehydratase [Streptomyces sp. NBC_01476]|uniref:4a-hydroxytetrahydrobiopterin dehydratase n=1 Tax=Streptomyces sp. NBC_01476 TaxID=2903881 RepID=UPI002E2EE517|nr:4a-hydroxytetrahydrobiopterin dehydratase [Streptomyces sp. NBC_01476]